MTAAQIRSAQQAAAAAGLTVETRNGIPARHTIADDAAVVGFSGALRGLAGGYLAAPAAANRSARPALTPADGLIRLAHW